MKRYLLLSCFILFVTPINSFAGWEVSSPGPGGPVTPREPFFQSRIQQAQVQSVPSRPIAFNPSVRAPVVATTPTLAHRVAVFPTASLPGNYATLGQPRGIYAVSISGSLKENLERIMSRYHWRVVWKAPYDYNFDGRITGSSLPNVIEKLLQPFPLQAVMYMSNRTLAVTSRPRYKA